MAAALLTLWTAHATTVTFTKLANTDTHATKADTVCVPMPDGKPCGALSCAPPHHDSSPCNITYLEAACIATPHCAGFNTNGWLKSFIGTHEHYNDVDTYVASSVQPGPWKAPTLPPTVPPVPAPTPPFPQKEDWHYPSEENTDAEGALVYGDGLPRISMLVATSNTSGTLTLVRQNGSTAALKRPGDTAFGWTLRCFLVHFDATEGHVRAVVERDFARWGALVYYSIAANTIKPPIIMRKGLGELSAMKRPRYDLAGLSPTYWADTRDDPNDLVKDRAVKASEFGEPTFTAFASLLPPSKDYMEVGTIDAHSKFSLALDGRVRSANFSIYSPTLRGNETSGQEYSALLWDPRARVKWWPTTNWSEYKSALVGRYTRAVTIGAWTPSSSSGGGGNDAGRGFSLLAVPNTRRGISTQPYDTAEIFLRLVDATAGDGTSTVAYYGVESCVPAVPGGGPCAPLPGKERSIGDGGAELYAHLLAHTMAFRTRFSGTSPSMEKSGFPDGNAMRVALPGDGTEGTRLVDMARATMAASMANYIGLRPNYGDGTNYWSVAQKDRGSLSLENYALDHTLLLWGLVDDAADRVEYYLNTYVRNASGLTPNANLAGMEASLGPPGSIDLKHWEDGCVYADGLADYGRWVELYVDVARAKESRSASNGDGSKWIERTFPQIKLLAAYSQGLHVHNVTAPGKPGAGMIWGSGEHDTCHCEQNFYSTSLWAWRGWVALARFIGDTDVSVLPGAAALKASLESDATTLKHVLDVNLALDAEVIHTAGGGIFLPPWAAANMTPYTSMVERHGYAGGASYANFRYYSETLSSGGLSAELSAGLQQFRESRTGTLSGMTRFQDHLDDMPATGYARAGLTSDRVSSYLALLFGHIANYQSRGTFQATEQLSLYGDGGQRDGNFAFADSYRGLLAAGRNEIDLDFCVPSTTLVAFMLRWMLVMEGRDDDTLWLLKGTPRRFFTPSRRAWTVEETAPLNASIFVADAPTRYGDVGVTVVSIEAASTPGAIATIEATVSINLRGRGFVNSTSEVFIVALRLRDYRGMCPTGSTGTRMTAELVWSSGSAVASPAMSFDVITEMVNVTVARPKAAEGGGDALFLVRAGFKCM